MMLQIALPPIDSIWETPQFLGLIFSPPLPLRYQAEAAFLMGTGKEKAVCKGKEKAQLEGRYDDETNNGELDDESGDGLMMNPSTHPTKTSMMFPHSSSFNR